MPTGAFGVAGEAFLLESNDSRLLDLAARLWEPRPAAGSPGRDGAILMRLLVRPGGAGDALPERLLAWELGPSRYRESVPDLLEVRIGLDEASVTGEVNDGLLQREPAFVARALLESPAAILLGRRAFTPLHAGAVVGSRGAVVVRGGAGAGKSTLVAAAFRDGLDVLGDESVLVSRADPDEIVSAVRDLTLLPEGERLLGLAGRTEAAFAGGEAKRRVDLFAGSTPERRRARRAATLLLGPRAPGPARLVPLADAEFLEAFREGEVPQERLGGDPDAVARAWADSRSFRLDGAEDLAGAVAIVRGLAQGAGA